MLVTGSADKTIKLLDMTNNFKEIGSLKATDVILSGDLYESFLAVGCGDGNILAYNLDTMECLFGFGCDNKGGVTNIKIVADKGKIVTAGEGGQGLILKI
jgi:WD40 repeat protein